MQSIASSPWRLALLIAIIFLGLLILAVALMVHRAKAAGVTAEQSDPVPDFTPVKGYFPLRAIVEKRLEFPTDRKTKLVVSPGKVAINVSYEQNEADDIEAIVHLRIADKAGAVWQGDAYISYADLVMQLERKDKKPQVVTAKTYDELPVSWKTAFHKNCLFSGVVEQLGDQAIFDIKAGGKQYRINTDEEVPRFALAVLDDPKQEQSTMLLMLSELLGDEEDEEEVPHLVFDAPCLPFILRNYLGRHPSLPEDQWFNNPPIVFERTKEKDKGQAGVAEVK